MSLCLLFVAGTAMGDWDPCDPYKMHFPQLPDLDGWDVEFSQSVVPQLADDWLCPRSGEVDDVHLWYSWEGDKVGIISAVTLGIYSNSPDPDGGGPLYSEPNELLWSKTFDVFKTRFWDTGDQGWYDPINDYYNLLDHINIYQLNIVDIRDPFYQEEGEIYWLSVSLDMGEDPNQPGWKTSENHFMDDAVWWDGANWNELKDPITDESLDLAFVITPEPTTIALLGLGGLLLRRRKR
jgi:hypothetical protein